MRRLRIPLSIVIFAAVLFDIREAIQIHDHGYPPSYGFYQDGDGAIVFPQASLTETILYSGLWVTMLFAQLVLFLFVLRLWRRR